MMTSPTSGLSARANSMICRRSSGPYSLSMTNSIRSQSVSGDIPASLLILSRTLWQWKELCSVSKYRICLLFTGKLAS